VLGAGEGSRDVSGVLPVRAGWCWNARRVPLLPVVGTVLHLGGIQRCCCDEELARLRPEAWTMAS